MILRLVAGAAAALMLASIPPESIPGLMAWLQTVTQWLLPAETIQHFGTAQATVAGQADQVIHMSVQRTSGLVIGEKYIASHPDSLAQVSTLKSTVLQPAILALPLLAAWPIQRADQQPRVTTVLSWRVCAWVVLLPLAVISQVPAQLSAAVWNLYLESFASAYEPGVVIWTAWLDAGGRWALALLFALAALALANWMASLSARAPG